MKTLTSLLPALALVVTGCASPPPTTAIHGDGHYRPGDTVRYMDGRTSVVQPPPPGPPTSQQLARASEWGQTVVATGRGMGMDAAGQLTRLEAGEPVEYVSFNPDTDQVLVRRMKYNRYVTIARSELRLE